MEEAAGAKLGVKSVVGSNNRQRILEGGFDKTEGVAWHKAVVLELARVCFVHNCQLNKNLAVGSSTSGALSWSPRLRWQPRREGETHDREICHAHLHTADKCQITEVRSEVEWE